MQGQVASRTAILLAIRVKMVRVAPIKAVQSDMKDSAIDEDRQLTSFLILECHVAGGNF